ncbi:4-hydroxy-tetrahydrodipicolinate synthase [Elusimicrobium posterum]|uniref:4-hydroxy-tetrahydrodipicolinate synthase n=1 Tax=Elusimicrobium posterum TaxID=3116653 RepID=UPI003C722E53
MFTGVYPALITPFKEDGKIDFAAMEKIIKALLATGIDGIVLLGTTAETPTLSAEEKKEIVEFATKLIPQDKKVIIGIGSNSTESTVKAGKEFLQYNPDAFLVVTPYYNKPNPSGLIAHYKKVAELGKPILVYHIPGRTGLKVPVKVMQKLVEEVPLIKGVKESDYDINHVTESCVKLSDKINILCGNDDMYLQMQPMGCTGIISAASNVLAKVFVDMYKNKGTEKSFETFKKAYDVIGACYYETNPTCAKYIMSKLGLCREDVRLPLGPLSEETKKRIDAVLEKTDKNLLLG